MKVCPRVKGHTSPMVTRSVFNSTADHTWAATPNTNIHEEAKPIPGICLATEVTSG